ncbi:MAG: zf-HC2 domain-containing protein [Spirochaetia bacterium]|nr:zf-HC2 domain-containing protein [Spirochaetia bacterium]
MCYDEQVISAYVDGELEASVHREIEEHIDNCDYCRSIQAEYHSVKELFLAVSNSPIHDTLAGSHAKARVWQQIQRKTRRETAQSFWHRQIQVPLPLAAGVIAAVAVLAFTLIFSPFSSGIFSSDQSGAPLALQEDDSIPSVPTNYPATENSRPELEQLLRFLSDQGAAVEVKIQLPSASKIQVSGEPQLLRAADFRRSGE